MERLCEKSAEEFLDVWKQVWEHIAYKLKAIFALSEKDYGIVRNGQVAELAACIPFWAGCRNALRKAFYITMPLVADATGHDILDANPDDYADDKLRRLEEIPRICSDGIPARLEQGVSRLATCMYWDCLQDMEIDRIVGKTSPGHEYARGAISELKAKTRADGAYDAIMPNAERSWWWRE